MHTFVHSPNSFIYFMKKITFLLFLLMSNLIHVSGAGSLTIKAITDGEFNARKISDVTPIAGTDLYAAVSKDNSSIVAYSFKTGKQVQTLFDKNNTMGERIATVDGYIFSPKGNKMLVQTNTKRIYRRSFKADYYIYDIKSTKLEKLSQAGPQQSPVWSADGQKIAFVRDNNIYLVKLLYNNSESQVTKDGKKNSIINGIPDWVYEEEFAYNTAFCFNADGSKICWVKFDESKVNTYTMQLFKGTNPEKRDYADYPGLYSYKYPKAGFNNSKVSVWSYDTQSHKTNRLNVPVDADGYMPRIFPTDNPSRIIVCTMNRHQDELNFYSVNPSSTVSTLILRENVPKYVPESVLTDVVIGKQTILLPSDRDGFMKGYIYNMNGALQRTVGAGNCDITKFYAYNEANGDVFYQAATVNPHDRQVFVSHGNGKSERLTRREGWNDAIVSADFQYFLNKWSDYNTPYLYTLCDKRGKVLSTPVDNSELKKVLQRIGRTNVETFSFQTSEGIQLDGWMVKPENFDAGRKYPVIMFQYGGPGSQEVRNSWDAGSMGNGCLFDQYFAQQGFIVACVDGRGTAGRGSEFEKSVYLNLGDLESKDQEEAARWLGSLSFVDKNRIGIWGWSYGGFNTLMSMSRGTSVFKAGVAVAPVTDWKYYDTVYTERYMRTPKENPDGYARNPIGRAANLHGHLLLCHGVADDNVNPQHTFEYAEALVQADKDFKENYYTNRNHSIYGGNTRNHLLRQVANFLMDHLGK